MSFSQFDLRIELIDASFGDKIRGSYIRLGDRPRYYGFKNLDVRHLDDTLVIQHSDYKFEALPLTAHGYELIESTITVKVYGHPYINRKIEVHAPIARSSKIKTDSVTLQVAYRNSYYGIQYIAPNQDVICNFNKPSEENNYYHQRVAYADLQEGEILMNSLGEPSTVKFNPEEWYQIICFMENTDAASSQSEILLLKKYFLNIQYSELRHEETVQSYETKIHELREEIDSLEVKIQELLGNPIPEIIEIPYEMEEIPIAEIIDFPDVEAEPAGGMENFTNILTSIVSKFKTKYSGNITLELWVGKDGRISYNVLHASPDTEEIISDLRYHTKSFKWTPAEKAGRKVRTRVLVSIDITAN